MLLWSETRDAESDFRFAVTVVSRMRDPVVWRAPLLVFSLYSSLPTEPLALMG